MGSLSIIHWLIVFLAIGSPIMGVIRGVKNSSILHAVLSVVIPVYGLILAEGSCRAARARHS
jgi:hypothetical protein